jgi:hypothetical protein
MKKLLICIFAISLTTISAQAARNTFMEPVFPVICDTSARPDSFGYTWVDNDNGGSPVFNWRDISGIGVRVMGLQDDNVSGQFDIGFDFPYYWYTVDHLYVGSNGYISFSSNANYSQAFKHIPTPAQPNDIVAPLAGDLDFTRTSSNPSCYYYTNSLDTFIVSWLNVREWPPPNDPDSLTLHTFQMILCKSDSSITFQYGTQIGTFDNGSAPDTHSCQIGIEDLVGRTGLSYLSDWTPATRVPHNGLVVRFHPSPRPNFVFRDAGIKGGMNENSGAEFIKLNQPFTPKALVKNYGTVVDTSVRVTCQLRRDYFNVYQKYITIASMAPGEETWAIFPDTILNTLSVYSAIFYTTMTGDNFGGNNRDTTELNSYILPGQLGYVTDSITQYYSWQGGHGGWANEFVMPEPVRVTNFNPDLMMDGTYHAYLFLMPADINGEPDVNNILWSDTIIFADTDWIDIPVSPPVAFAAGQKFFAAVLAESTGVQQGMDQNTPLSNRGWEYTTSYAVSRDRDVQDIGIRVTATLGIGIGESNTLPSKFRLHQNYPNPFNANTEINFDLANKSDIILEIYNIAGQKIKTLVDGTLGIGNHKVIWNGTTERGEKTASGVYFYRLRANDRTETRKMVLLK